VITLESLKKKAAEKTKAQATSMKAIPEGWLRIVACSRAGEVIGRTNGPADQIVNRLGQLVDGTDVPKHFGYALVYGSRDPSRRIAYLTHSGRLQLDETELQSYLAPRAKGEGRSRKAAKPAPAEPKVEEPADLGF
jgi:hypothetical protein